jgi:predicted 3-demethylubiquinone-9 3-methyltransferase (glyoxalase superfamily)
LGISERAGDVTRGRVTHPAGRIVGLGRPAPDRIERVELHGPGEDGPEATVHSAVLPLNGKRFVAIDSAISHPFDIAPSISLFVACDTEEEITRLSSMLSGGATRS